MVLCVTPEHGPATTHILAVGTFGGVRRPTPNAGDPRRTLRWLHSTVLLQGVIAALLLQSLQISVHAPGVGAG